MAIKRGSKVESTFGSASMTDLIFLLLIFFMVATTLITPNAIKVLLPQSNSTAKEKPKISVTITKDLVYYVGTDNKTPMTLDKVEEALRAQAKTSEEPIISVSADQGVPWGEIVKVRNMAERNKYTLIFVTIPER